MSLFKNNFFKLVYEIFENNYLTILIIGIKNPNDPTKDATHQITNFGFFKTSIPKLCLTLSILVIFSTSGNSDLYVKHNKLDKPFIIANKIKASLRPYDLNNNEVIIGIPTMIIADKKFVKPLASESFLEK